MALGGFAGHASAADIPYGSSGVHYNWSGFYVGAHAGYGWIKGDDTFDNTDRVDGFPGGAHADYNDVFQQFLLGVEVDGSLLDIRGTASAGDKQDAEWLTSAPIHAGFTHDRFLLFATGGISAALLELTSPGSGARSSSTHIGWVLGRGVEAFLTESVSAGLEYQHHQFGSETCNLGGTGFRMKGELDLVRAQFNYHFRALRPVCRKGHQARCWCIPRTLSLDTTGGPSTIHPVCRLVSNAPSRPHGSKHPGFAVSLPRRSHCPQSRAVAV